MVLKRKRSESELGSVFISTPRLDGGCFNFDALSAMDTARRGFFASRLSTASHLPGRTMKRFRDNRPSESEIHQHTLDVLYSAQRWPNEPHYAPPQSPKIVHADAPIQAHTQSHHGCQQRSLHSFWNLPGPAISTSSLTSSPASSAMSPPSPAIAPRSIPTDCEDCGAGLGGGDHDVMMDVDGYGSGVEDQACARMGTREASHAGSWYEEDAEELSSQLDEFLDRVPASVDDNVFPIPGARVIIAPHAGYSYSGPCAAWAYKALDLRSAKRVFILGPSHTYYLRGCALTTFDKYETPFGDLVVDKATTSELKQTGKFSEMPTRREVDEHSLEMHIPYLWKRLEQTFGSDSNKYPPIVPILVGNASEQDEKSWGQLLSQYLKDPETAWIVSSDFCHWGSRFSYRPEFHDGEIRDLDKPGTQGAKYGVLQAVPDWSKAAEDSAGPKIHEVIKVLDQMAMDAVESGAHSEFYQVIRETRNTVCGRHPIGVMMAALEAVAKEGLKEGKGKFNFVQYQRSNLVKKDWDFSVSYASAYAVV
ncbi:protein MEMO1 [Chaetomidium leptoderma]|uniref:Protein MEMO1 n=1 Tax=Chaetomidium leptoderma TaxID=669021 RepID=A0AAN6ZX44_9PEZI|nr:protein MEMO1 [Chaetomidium leptoderma]